MGGETVEKTLVSTELLESKAGFLKVLAHPIRLCIVLGLLDGGRCNVTKMHTCLDLPQSTVSQHLARLREAGIVTPERHGTEVFYRVADEDTIRLIQTLFPAVGPTKER